MNDMKQANGYECFNCGEIELDPELARANVECQTCGSDNTIQRALTDCDDEGCLVDSHDWSAGWHVDEGIEA